MLSYARHTGALSRKELLRLVGLGGAGALLAACAPAAPPTQTAAPKPAEKPAAAPTTAPAAAPTTAPAAAATMAPAAAATKPAAATTAPGAAATTAPAAAAKPAAAGGKQFKLRMGVLPAEANPEWASYVRFKEIVEKDTGGNVQVTLIGNSQLGTERELTEQVKLGALEMTTGGGDIQGFAPEVGLFYLPFLYPTDEGFVKVWDIRTSPIAQQVAKIVLEKTSTIRALAFLPAAGTRNLILKNKPIKTIEDFKGVKIRVDTAPTSFKTMQALGAAPVPIAFPEVYNALQTGVVDAAENILSTFRVQKWAEVAKFVSLTEHNRTVHVAMISEPFFQSLGKEYQDVLNKAAVEMATVWHDRTLEVNKAESGELEKMGIKINKVEDTAKWVAAASPLQDEWAKANKFEAELKQVRDMVK